MYAYGKFRCKATGKVVSATWGISPFTLTLPDGTKLDVKEDDFFFENGSRSIGRKEFLDEWDPVDQVARKLFSAAHRRK